MNSFLKDPQFKHHAFPSVVAFIATSFYLIYLSLIAQPVIVHDSIGYLQLGDVFNQHGILGYLSTGAQREPVYPFFISLALNLAALFKGDSGQILIWIQMLFLMFTQVMVFMLAKEINLRRGFTALSVFLVGFIPSIINSVFWVYSEVFTYALIVLLVVSSARLWMCLDRADYKGALVTGLVVGVVGVGLVFNKAVFELILPVLFLVFSLRLVIDVFYRRGSVLKAGAIILVMAAVFYVPVQGYKWLNYKQHGAFVFTNRGPWALFGYVSRRLEPMTPERFKAMFAYIPGPDFCSRVIPSEQCLWWSIYPADKLGIDAYIQTQATIKDKNEVDQHLMTMSAGKMFSQPLNFIGLTYIESFKALFWFNDYDSQVVYPSWLGKMYEQRVLFLWASFLCALLTLWAYVMTAIRVIKSIPQLLSATARQPQVLESFIFILINAYTASYALVQVTPRYILPLVPLYIVMIIFSFQSCALAAKKSRQ